MSLNLTPQDRLLILAPHPDDESLATGGLILRARHLGATVRILFATNGDNNPWPQRWVEKRWHIGSKEQQRWGNTRQQEARLAVHALGLSSTADAPDEAARFLNLPDQGTSRLLLSADQPTLDRFCREIADFRPTHCVIPSQHDLHPDHNALHLLWQIATDRLNLNPAPRQIVYLVHCRRPDLVPHQFTLQLTPQEQQAKTDAILCHQTQMVLSKKRFIAYAQPEETYHHPTPVAAQAEGHRIHTASRTAHSLRLSLQLTRRHGGASILVVAQTTTGAPIRYELPLPRKSAIVPLRDLVTGHSPGTAEVTLSGREATVEIPLHPVSGETARLFVKYRRRTLFLDETGWREVPQPPPSAPATSRDALGSVSGVPA